MVVANCSRLQAGQALGRVPVVLGSNKLVVEEAEHSIHGALYAVRGSVKQGALLPRGCVPDAELAWRGVLDPEGSDCPWLIEYSQTLSGMESYCIAVLCRCYGGHPVYTNWHCRPESRFFSNSIKKPGYPKRKSPQALMSQRAVFPTFKELAV